MKLIVCLDERNGMAFNRRRQSTDAVVVQKIMELVDENPLWMNSYSGYLFAEPSGNIQICEEFMDNAKTGEYCFVENLQLEQYLHRFREIFVFRWNRVYPSDLVFPDVLRNGTVIMEFAGKSHKKITLEVYRL